MDESRLSSIPSKCIPSTALLFRAVKWLASAMWILFLSVISGCASQYGELYQAHNLPVALNAPVQQNTQVLSLAGLSPGTANTNLIGPGDLLDVTIAASLNPRDIVTFPIRVDEKGHANIGWIGHVQLGGLELEEAEERIAQTSIENRVYNAPNVTVGFKRKRMNRVMVLGAVKSPGEKMLPSGSSDLLTALITAGGLADDAGPYVEIKNAYEKSPADTSNIANTPLPGLGDGLTQAGYAGGPGALRDVRIDLISAAKKGSNGYFIADGGVVMVEKRDPKAVHVTGLVRKPGRQDFPVDKDLTVLDALSQAGWTSSQVADKVYIIRQLEGQPAPVVIECSVRRSKFDATHNVRLAPGDLVSVEHTPATVLLEAINIVRVGVSASLNPLIQ